MMLLSKTRVFLLLCITLGTTMISACQRTPDLQNLEGFAQGTTWHIRYWAESPVDAAAVQQAVQNRFAQIDAAMSGYRPDSIIEQFNARQDTDSHEVGSEIVALVEQARAVSQASMGCYDITIKPMFDLWGFRADVFTPPNEADLQKNMARIGMDKLIRVNDKTLRKTVPTLQVDLASIGQGYSVGQIAAVLESFGIQHYLVEIGGELQTRGHKPGAQPWRVAVEKPIVGDTRVEKIISIERDTPLAVMTSGTYRHYFDRDNVRYSHILDARTGRPVQHDTVAVTVLNADPTTADAWSTALLCLGTNAGLPVAEQHGIAALFFTQDASGQHEFSNAPWRELQGVTVE